MWELLSKHNRHDLAVFLVDNSYSIQDATHTESKITKTRDIDHVSEHARGLYTHNEIFTQWDNLRPFR